MGCISGVGSSQPHSAFDQSFSSKRVDYSGTTSHNSDDDEAASEVDAYEESYLSPTLDMSKHSYLRPEELETVTSEGVLPLATSTGLACILLCIVFTNGLHSTILLLFIHYAYFVDVGVQPSSLPATTVVTLPSPAVASIEVIATSSPTDPGMGSSTRVLHMS